MFASVLKFTNDCLQIFARAASTENAKNADHSDDNYDKKIQKIK